MNISELAYRDFNSFDYICLVFLKNETRVLRSGDKQKMIDCLNVLGVGYTQYKMIKGDLK